MHKDLMTSLCGTSHTKARSAEKYTPGSCSTRILKEALRLRNRNILINMFEISDGPHQ